MITKSDIIDVLVLTRSDRRVFYLTINIEFGGRLLYFLSFTLVFLSGTAVPLVSIQNLFGSVDISVVFFPAILINGVVFHKS